MVATMTLARRADPRCRNCPRSRLSPRRCGLPGQDRHADAWRHRVRPRAAPGNADAEDIRQALALSAAGPDADATIQGAARGGSPTQRGNGPGSAPFSIAPESGPRSARIRHGTWMLGGPEVGARNPPIASAATPGPTGRRSRRGGPARAAPRAARRRRCMAKVAARRRAASYPQDLRPAALVVPTERVRDDAAGTMRYFTEQGVPA